MGLFGKKEKTTPTCCGGEAEGSKEDKAKDCGCECGEGGCEKEQNQEVTGEKGLVIKVLGSGCKNCITLADNVKKVLEQMQLEASIVKITDFGEITSYGVMSTPALVVNEKVVSYGKVLKPQEITKILEKVIG
ncbi:MAG: thioredoxin family protein [Mobilitalea sp.]